MNHQKISTTIWKAVLGALILFLSLFPIYWLAAMAVRPTEEMKGRIPLLPRALTWSHFEELFTEHQFGRALVC